MQQGWNMMPLVRDFLPAHQSSGVVLSPRAYRNPDSLLRDAGEIHDLDGVVLCDPQFYEPRTDHPNILVHEYWEGADFSTREFEAHDFCERVVEYQRNRVHVDEVILPGRFSDSADEPWLELQMRIAEAGSRCAAGTPTYMTVAVGPSVVSSESRFDAVLDQVVSYPVDGVYFLVQHPHSRFLIDDENFLYALLDGFLSIRRAGKRILYGYANQQSLLFAAAGVTELASGNFRNTRQFDTTMFMTQDPEDRQRSTWYYDAGTLGEYRPQQLTLGYRRGLRGRFGPECDQCRPLLEAETPANVPWGERDAFHHFLHELRREWTLFGISGPTGAERAAVVAEVLAAAIGRAQLLQSDGFMSGQRGFLGPASDASTGALAAFRQDRARDLSRLSV
ncbi:MAG: hypothetical protein AB7R89_03325 [Dehalococcoidia bacterium]